MELSEFVSKSITEIISGIKDAQNNPDNAGAYIVPNVNKIGEWVDRNVTAFQKIDFDIALSESVGNNSKSGIGVLLGSFGMGTEHKQNTAQMATSRLCFTVPVFLPEKDWEQENTGSVVTTRKQ